jgi:hypothetical protein
MKAWMASRMAVVSYEYWPLGIEICLFFNVAMTLGYAYRSVSCAFPF